MGRLYRGVRKISRPLRTDSMSRRGIFIGGMSELINFFLELEEYSVNTNIYTVMEPHGSAYYIIGESIMNKFSKCAYAAFLALTLVSAVGCSSTPKHEGTGEYIDDSMITTKVKAAIFNESTLKSTEINVETFKGVVQLSGFVHDAADVNKATEGTRKVTGVSSIKNIIQVK